MLTLFYVFCWSYQTYNFSICLIRFFCYFLVVGICCLFLPSFRFCIAEQTLQRTRVVARAPSLAAELWVRRCYTTRINSNLLKKKSFQDLREIGNNSMSGQEVIKYTLLGK